VVLRPPVRVLHREVERLSETVCRRVPRSPCGVHRGFGHRITGWVVVVQDTAPVGIDLMHVVAIPERVRAVRSDDVRDLTPRRVRLRHVLAQAVRDVDPKTVDAAVGPEAYGPAKVVPYFFVLPVEIRLLGREAVKVPLAVTGRRPCRSPEKRLPVVGWMLAARADAVAEEISITFWGTTAGGEGLRKPGMPIGSVIGHDVDDHIDVGGMQRRDHRVEVNQGTEPRIDVAMIINVVTTVGKRRRIERGQPHSIDTKRAQVRDPRGNARQIPDAITVA